jgi:hypothetical protein
MLVVIGLGAPLASVGRNMPLPPGASAAGERTYDLADDLAGVRDGAVLRDRQLRGEAARKPERRLEALAGGSDDLAARVQAKLADARQRDLAVVPAHLQEAGALDRHGQRVARLAERALNLGAAGVDGRDARADPDLLLLLGVEQVAEPDPALLVRRRVDVREVAGKRVHPCLLRRQAGGC